MFKFKKIKEKYAAHRKLAMFLIIIIGLPLFGFLAFTAECATRTNAVKTTPLARTEKRLEQSRPEESTYLTLPEWYIVYSAEEYADYIKAGQPSGFPYFPAIEQYWRNYCDVNRVAKNEGYKPNLGDHATLIVIGVSFTIENTLRGIYENTLGRLTQPLSGIKTPEDIYSAQVAKDYADSLYTVPWYEYPFGSKIGPLWKGNPITGSDILRRWERKVYLTSEYSSKAAYGWLIKKATKSAYGDVDLDIKVLTGPIPQPLLKEDSRIKFEKKNPDGTVLLTLPRYEPLTQILKKFSSEGVETVSIAGNDDILVTAIGPVDTDYRSTGADVLYSLPILTKPETLRTAFKVRVSDLSFVLREIGDLGATVEHVYDY